MCFQAGRGELPLLPDLADRFPERRAPCPEGAGSGTLARLRARAQLRLLRLLPLTDHLLEEAHLGLVLPRGLGHVHLGVRQQPSRLALSISLGAARGVQLVEQLSSLQL